MKQQIKRILAVALCILLLCGAMPIIASAETYSGTCGANLNWNLNTNTGVLSITGTGKMYNYELSKTTTGFHTSAPWNGHKMTITSITIGSGVTTIGHFAFAAHSNLTTVSLPDGLKGIGAGAFFMCKSITSVTIPDSVVSLANSPINDKLSNPGLNDYIYGVFKICEKLETVNLGAGLTYLSECMFQDCTSLKSITIPGNIKETGEFTFLNCSALETVRYLGSPAQWQELIHNSRSIELASANVEYVCSGTETNGMRWSLNENTGALTIQHTGAMADYTQNDPAPWYNWRDAICSVAFSDGVTHIGNYAFAACNSLEQVDVPASVESIGTKAFYDCTALQSVQFHRDEIEIAYDSFARSGEFTVFCTENSFWHAFAVSNGLRYVLTDETAATAFVIRNRSLLGYSGTAAKITVPSAVSSIGYEAFRGNDTITRVALPQSVANVANGAFADCEYLSEVFLPDSVTSIGANAFEGTDTTIICMENSYAHKYAVSHNMDVRFVHILIDLEKAVVRTEIPYADEPEISLVHLTGVSLQVVRVGSLPRTTVYRIGEALDIDGVSIEAHYTNGMTSLLRDGFSVSQPVFNKPGEQTVTLNYCGKTVDFTVTVTNEVISGDTDQSGMLDLKDVVLLSRSLAGGWDVELADADADVNKDGAVDLKDAVILRRYLAGGWGVVLK